MKSLLVAKAAWCAPCRAMAPIFQSLKDEGYKIEMFDIDEQPTLAEKYNISSVPTILVFEGGTYKERHLGAMTKSKLKQIIEGA